ncbi:MAG: hypothetical protein LAQ69_32330 [Acidobacteriia bacterium]|nr:hypothetical protein [Terriglobia bacterium]
MMELVDREPDVNVQPAEYRRLLGYPPEHEWSERARELADWARAWYAQNGRPWVYAREAENLEIAGGSIHIEGVPFHSQRLQGTLERAGAHGLILVAAGAGVELEQEARKLWDDGKPDEYFFLEVFGSAVVEQLTHMAGARLCAWAEELGMAVLPHYSPGYPEWEIGEQARLLNLIGRSGKQALPYPLEALDSGALRPKKSQLAVFGFTRRTERVRRLTELIPCENCSFLPCQYRRAPQGDGAADDRRAPGNVPSETFHFVSANGAGDGEVKYTVKTKALKRWAEERLTLHRSPDGTVEALFRYDGTTCTNMGHPLTFHYHVGLGPREDGYRIREQRCGPAPGDTGHTHMCRYQENSNELLNAIASEKPCLGQPLSAVLSWQRPECAPGCYCEPPSREHKWGIVLETIHFALAHQAKKEP